MMNITRSASPARQRIKMRVASAPAVHHTAALPTRAWMISVSVALAVGAVTYAGAAHADEGETWCGHAAPTVLAKRPAAAISYAPHPPSIHRRRVPAMLHKPAPEVGCTPESLAAAMPPLSVPAVGQAPDPVVAEVIPPVSETPLAAEAPRPVVAEGIPAVPAETPLAAEAPAPVAAEGIQPVSMVTPQGAIAAAAAGVGPAAIPIGALVAYIGICVVGHACGGNAGTLGGSSAATTGTTGTH